MTPWAEVIGQPIGHSLPPDAVRNARVSAAFGMVYRPLDTPFLRAARGGGARTIDDLAMLIGQARRSFALFFGAAAPLDKDADLRALITASAFRSHPDSALFNPSRQSRC